MSEQRESHCPLPEWLVWLALLSMVMHDFASGAREREILKRLDAIERTLAHTPPEQEATR